MYYFCTYFDHNYLNKGLALYYSLNEHCKNFKLFILCLDNECYKILSRMNLSHVILISMEEYEKNDLDLSAAKKNRSLVEYYFTCTPSLPFYILNHYADVDIITYLDSDLYFYSSPDPIYQELGLNSILIIGHRFPESLRHFETYGIYNVGYLSFRRDQNGLDCLKRWREQCIQWCHDYLEGNKFAEQKYLDVWPSQFNNVVILQYRGAGLSPWNLSNYQLRIRDYTIIVDDQKLIFYHFHGLKRIKERLYDSNLSRYKVKPNKIIIERLYTPYIRHLENNTLRVSEFNDNKPLNYNHIRPQYRNNESTGIVLKIGRSIYNIYSYLHKFFSGDLIHMEMK